MNNQINNNVNLQTRSEPKVEVGTQASYPLGGGNTTPVSGTPGVKKLPKNVSENPKYTENWINIKKISNGIIYNDSGEMITGIKINPKNIFILDYSVMDNTLLGLMNFYNTLEFEFWLIVADRPVDITMYEAEMQLLFNNTQDQVIRKVISQDMAKGDYFINNDVVDTEYYLLFKEKNMDALQKKIRNMINGMAGCGMIASQTSTDDLRMIVDNFLNGGRNFETGTVMPL